MLRNIVTSLLDLERIVTTVPKAKEVRRVAEQMITLGKRGDLHARRQAMAYIRSKEVVAPASVSVMLRPWPSSSWSSTRKTL
jgi:large subunit ribosomal protein L17